MSMVGLTASLLREMAGLEGQAAFECVGKYILFCPMKPPDCG